MLAGMSVHRRLATSWLVDSNSSCSSTDITEWVLAASLADRTRCRILELLLIADFLGQVTLTQAIKPWHNHANVELALNIAVLKIVNINAGDRCHIDVVSSLLKGCFLYQCFCHHMKPIACQVRLSVFLISMTHHDSSICVNSFVIYPVYQPH
jgi:hypothetical protein